MIVFDKVTKLFRGGTTAVDDLSMEIHDGALTVFVATTSTWLRSRRIASS